MHIYNFFISKLDLNERELNAESLKRKIIIFCPFLAQNVLGWQ